MTRGIPDRIERKVWLKAPRSRVWRALTDVAEFSRWFGVETTGQFAPRARLRMTSTHPGTEGVSFEIVVDRMEPEHLLSWRWQPGAEQPRAGEDAGRTTLVEFRLDEIDGGTRVSLTESGFGEVSLLRRARVFEENSSGWDYQIQSLQNHVARQS